ncbi:MAG: PilZ domain-containing protein [Pseudomonadota bacterium]
MAFGLRRKQSSKAEDSTAAQVGSRYTEDAAMIAEAFRHFRDQRTELTLQFQGIANSYRARVLDLTQGILLIEDIVPRDGLTHMHDALPFSLAGRSKGMYLYANEMRCETIETERGVPYFKLAIPRSVLIQQRRKSQRMSLPPSVKAQGSTVTLIHNEIPLRGDILDISAGGLRAQFYDIDPPGLETGTRIARCELHVTHQLELRSTAIVRHAVYDRGSRDLLCGLELSEMNVTDRRRLEHYIQSLSVRGPTLAAT